MATRFETARSRYIGIATLVIVAAFVGFYALYIIHHSDFTNDDLDNLLLMRKSSFWSFVMTPTDVHFVPLNRLLSWVVYQLAPMNFTLVVAVSCAFHVATIVYLYRLLVLLGAGGVSYLIVAGYAVSVVPLFGMIWWAHAEHRFPYVFCAVCAIYHYMVWLRQGARWHAVICVLAFVAGFGFYEKSVMIPAQMLAVALLADPRQLRVVWRRSLILPVALGFLSLAYVLAYLTLNTPTYHAAPGLALHADIEFIKMLGIAMSSILSYGMQSKHAVGWSLQTALVVGLWLALFAFSVVRNRRCLWLWLGMLAILVLDDLPIAVSNRIFFFDLLTPHQYRFTFEELFVVAIFLGLILRDSLAGRQPAAHRRVRLTAAIIFLATYTVGNLISLHAAEKRLMSLRMQDLSHDYIHNLRHDLRRLQVTRPTFAQSKLPGYMSVFSLIHGAGPVVTLFVPQARTRARAGVATYRVAMDGHVRPAH